MTTKATPATPETAKQAAELEAMLRMLDLSSGCFSLSIAVCNGPALRDHLIERLRNTRPDIQVVHTPVGTTDVLAHIQQQIDGSKCSAVFVVGLEDLLSSSEARHPVLRHLNASRELLERNLHCPVVLWLPEYAAGILAREAPDLWRYRSHRFEFVSEQAEISAGMQDVTSGNTEIASNLSADEKHFRIAELEQRIEEAGPKPGKQLIPHVSTWLNELAFLKQSLGQIDEAGATLRTLLAIEMRVHNKEGIALAYLTLGNVQLTRGDLTAAEELYRKALAIGEELGNKKGLAAGYNNLGLLYAARGDLTTAEKMYHKALAIDEELGDKEGLAARYCGLGILYSRRGDLTTAEDMYRKALAIDEELGNKKGLAILYGNLGNMHFTTGDLTAAEEIYRKALAIDEELGNKKGLASAYGGLGNVHIARGDLAAAEEMYRKALKLFHDMGLKPRVEWIEGLLRKLEAGS